MSRTERKDKSAISPDDLAHDRRTKVSERHAAQRAAMARAPRPYLAATVIILREGKSGPEVLMGQRSARHDFMPDVFVFPGGRVDRADSFAPHTGQISPRSRMLLEAALPPARARACLLAAIRETYEETGLLLGRKGQNPRNLNHPGWDSYLGQGYLPDLSALEVMARAETPPYRPKRFDTWFFLARLRAGRDMPVSDSHELLNTGWYSFEQAKSLKLHAITEIMLGEAEKMAALPRLPRAIPYSRYRHGRFVYDPFEA